MSVNIEPTDEERQLAAWAAGKPAGAMWPTQVAKAIAKHVAKAVDSASTEAKELKLFREWCYANCIQSDFSSLMALLSNAAKDKERADNAERQLAIIGEMAVVDFDYEVVAAVDSVVKDRTRYKDYLISVLKAAKDKEQAEERADVLEAQAEEASEIISELKAHVRILRGAMIFVRDECDWEGDKRIGPAIQKALEETK